MPFVTKNISEAGPAVLQAPAFLSGLSAQEAGIARGHFERTVNPQVAEAKAHCSTARRDGAMQLTPFAPATGLEKIGNGGA